MAAVERIEAAITKLERLKAESTPGPWVHDANDEPAVFTFGETVAGGAVAYINDDQQTGDHRPFGDGELIVTLHRTIDTQLAILRETHYQLTDGASGTGLLGTEYNLIVALADAILGDEHS